MGDVESIEDVGFTIEHAGLKITFYSEMSKVEHPSLGEDALCITDSGEEVIQNLIQYGLTHCKSAEGFKIYMESVREFYSHYLIDKSALNTLAYQLRTKIESL